MSYTLVYYFIPEDGEDQKLLNTFGIPKSLNRIKIEDIKLNFPLKGEYIYRVKIKHKKEYIFIDVIEENEVLPSYDNKIILKVNRINWGVKEHTRRKRSSREYQFIN